MRFVWAVAAFVLAALMIGAGIAQRTVLQGPRSETTAVSVSDDAPFVMIEGSVLTRLPGSQTLRVEGSGTVFASYGRTSDMKAWLAGTDYTDVTLGSDGSVQSVAVTPADSAPTAFPSSSATPTASPVPSSTASASSAGVTRSPVGSDLWLDEFQQDGELVAPLQLPADMSILVATDGTKPAPTDVSVSWPTGGGSSWSGPLIVAGGILMLVGVFLYVLAIRHLRRSRGPRRKGLPLPVTEPIDLAIEGNAKGVISATPSRRSLTRGRRAFVAVPLVAVAGLALSGCTADAWPNLAGSASPSPSASVIVPEGQQAPVVSEAQAERILTRISDTVAKADQSHDPAVAATRLDGAMLAERQTNYTLHAAIPDYAALPAIPASPLKIVLPQAYDKWPRTVMGVVDDEADKVSTIMVMTQKDPWSPYKLSYSANLEASTQMPDLAAAYVGASQVPPASEFLTLAPDKVAGAYADVINNGTNSSFYGKFDADGDTLRTSIAADRQKRLDEFNQTAASTGSLTFETTAGTQSPVALATLESGAIVAVTVHETDVVKPTNSDAVIKLTNNPTVKALVGADQSATGFTITYSDQLFFYVPGQNSAEKIRLLGASSNILEAKVIS